MNFLKDVFPGVTIPKTTLVDVTNKAKNHNIQVCFHIYTIIRMEDQSLCTGTHHFNQRNTVMQPVLHKYNCWPKYIQLKVWIFSMFRFNSKKANPVLSWPKSIRVPKFCLIIMPTEVFETVLQRKLPFHTLISSFPVSHF